MIIEIGKTRIMTDPGMYSLEQHDKVSNLNMILITHEHADHFHVESLKAAVKRMPDITVITNDSVGEILVKEGIRHRVMIHGDVIDHAGIHIEAYGKKHALIHKSLPQSSNVGFMIGTEPSLFFPGDALTDPKKKLDALALPVAGPWLKISESIDYALKLQPKMAFPVHDAVRSAFHHILVEKILTANGVDFTKLEEGHELVIEA